MPEEVRNSAEEAAEEGSAPRTTPEVKKTKGSRKWSLLFLLIFLITGAVTGLHMSGLLDIRPLVWMTIPRIPFVGDDLKEFFDVPEEYTLSVDERRRRELNDWQQRLDARERELNARDAEVEKTSKDLGTRMGKIQQMEAELNSADPKGKTASDATAEEKATMNELIRTYQEISPRKAALIVERLRDDLAVELLRKLPQDARAAILSKMEPRRAARMTERFAEPE